MMSDTFSINENMASTEANDRLNAWEAACLAAYGSRNAFYSDGKQYVWEANRVYPDGSVRGSVRRIVPFPHGMGWGSKPAGSFRIAADGSATHGPAFLRRIGERYWRAHERSAPRSSERWAATDRGWLFQVGTLTSLGHYLDYGPCSPHYAAEHDGKTVHAVSCVSRESAWFATPLEAQTWIEAQAH